jgi:hypothetical protein
VQLLRNSQVLTTLQSRWRLLSWLTEYQDTNFSAESLIAKYLASQTKIYVWWATMTSQYTQEGVELTSAIS